MARHQIIYTSCMRGIDGINDGQQIYSYDAGFSDCKSDEIKSLFTYQVPSLQPGVIMTEELALTMPSAFSYRLLKSERVATTLNTYLGRDYMGSAGRFGNHLCHSVVCDYAEMNLYPCEVYGSNTLKSSMKYEEVNNPNPPEYLPEADVETGYIVNPDNIIEFLGIGDHLEYFKKMVCAMLKFPTEKKRIVICDEKESIIMWIAALHYVLPLDIAKKVNFTTYEYDPELSPAQICGVISEGSRYNVTTYVSSGKHFVFDFLNNQFNDVDINNQFFDYLDTAFSFSYESLTAFHDFVIEMTSYREVDEKVYSAYELYSFFTNGISELNMDQFKKALEFSDDYVSADVKKNIVSKLIEYSDGIDELNDEYAFVVIHVMLKELNTLSSEQQKAVKQLIVNRLILSLSNEEITEQDFTQLYDSVDKIARSIDLSIPVELMNNHNRQALRNILASSISQWKLYFIVRIISDYVKDARLSIDELYPDRSIGSIYYGIVKAISPLGSNHIITILEKILDCFKDNSIYLVNMTWNIEGYLDDLNVEQINKKYLWDYFTKIVLSMSQNEVSEINEAFVEYERFEEMFSVFKARMEHEMDFKITRDIFKDTFEEWFAKCHKYAYEYSKKVLEVYQESYMRNASSLSKEDRLIYAKEILHLVMGIEMAAKNVEKLMQVVMDDMTLAKPDQENTKLIVEMQDYQANIRNKKLNGKLLLFSIGITFDKMASKKDVKKYILEIMSYADVKG